MLNFAELMATNPPRIEVIFSRGQDGEERFQWGMTNTAAPIMSVIGAIIRAQAELPLLEPGDWRHCCDRPSLILAWDADSKSVHWFVGPDIPMDPLLGMLETIKSLLVDSQLAQRAAANQSRIVGPDGSPMRGR